MRRYGTIALLFLLATGCSTQIDRGNPLDPDGTGPLAPGRVVGVVDVEGLDDDSGLAVHVLDSRDVEILGSPFETKSGGAFTSPGITPGQYVLSVDVTRGNEPIADVTLQIRPGLDTDVGTLRSAQRPPSGVISGMVTLDGEGLSLAATRVMLSSIDRDIPHAQVAITDSTGSYVFAGVPDGLYEVRAERTDFTPDRAEIDLATVARTVLSVPEMRLYPLSAVARFSVDVGGAAVIGAAYTNTPDVALLLLAFGGVNEMRVSEAAGFVENETEVAWREHQAEISWTLSAGEGSKTVYCQFRAVDANGSEVLRSDIYRAQIILDQTPPALVDFLLAPGAIDVSGRRFLTGDPSAVPVELVAIDSLAPVAGYKLVVGDIEPATVPFVDVTSETSTVVISELVTLSGAEGENRVSAQLTDAAGNASALFDTRVYIDTSPPLLSASAVVLDDGAPLTNSTAVSVALAADDGSGAGVSEIALANGSIDCAVADYRPFTTALLWSLPAVDAVHDVFVCFRDRVGNTSQASSSIELDTSPPAAGVLSMAGGADLTNQVTETLEILSADADALVTLSGDIAAVGADGSGWTYWNSTAVDSDGDGNGYGTLPVPLTVTFSPGDGTKTIHAVLRDVAGNVSLSFSDSIVVDTTAPTLGTIRVNGAEWSSGDAPIEVFQPTVTLDIIAADLDATRVEVSETLADLDGCNIGSDGCRAITSSLVFGLSAAAGVKSLYYRFFDDAGNGTVDGAGAVLAGEVQVTLTNNRPVPVFDFVTPSSILALEQSSYTLTFVGQSIASDSRVRIGDFEVTPDCSFSGSVVGTSCTPANVDADSCAGSPSCRNCCRVTLTPSSAAWQLTRLSGSYLSRIVTPEPVEGTGVSTEAHFIGVVAPPPRVQHYTVIGSIDGACLQGVLDDCALPYWNQWGVEESSTGLLDLHLVLWAESLMDNASVELEGSFGQVLYSGDFSLGGQPAGAGFIVELSSVSVDASDSSYALRVTNSPPGGGTVDLPFGVNWAARVVSETTTSTIRPTDLLTRKDGVFAERFAQPGYDAVTDTTTVTASLAMGAPGHALVGRSAAGDLMYRLETGPGVVGFPLGRVPTTFEVQGPPGASQFVIGTEPVKTPTGALGSESMANIGTVHDVHAVPGFDAGDIDGDGHVDLVVCNQLEPNIDILKGDGAGNFSAWITPFSGYLGTSVVVTDFDVDGRPDIAVVSEDDPGSIFIHRNLGGGQFERFGPYGGGYHPMRLRSADLDGDGFPDLVVAGGDSVLFYGTGTGALEDRVDVEAQGSWPTSVAVGDVSGDGRPDVIYAMEYADVYDPIEQGLNILLNDGTRSWSQPVYANARQQPSQIELDDMNNDGTLDAIVYNVGNTDTGLTVIPGLGDGSFGAPINSTTGTEYYALAVGDVDGDGHVDIVTTRYETGAPYVRIFNGAGDGTVSQGNGYPINPAQDDAHKGVYLRYLNDDAAYDVVTLGPETVHWRMGVGASSFIQPSGPIVTSVRQANLASCDFDHDGWMDLAASEYFQAEVFMNDPTEVLSLGTKLGTYGEAISWVLAEDFNADGKCDVIAFESTNNLVELYIGNGDGSFATGTPVSLAGPPGRAAALDANGDGRLDVVYTLDTNAALYLRLQTAAGGLTAASTLDLPDAPSALTVFDGNRDGHDDIAAVGGDQNGFLTLLYGRGDGSFIRRDLGETQAWYPDQIRSADLDADGYPDLAVQGSGNTYVYYGGETGLYDQVVSIDTEGGERDLIIADFGNDGILDLAQSSDNETVVTVVEGLGGRTFGEVIRYRYPEVGRIGVLASSDFNRDGVPDLIVGESSENGVGLVAMLPRVPGHDVVQELSDLPLATVPVSAAPGDFEVAAVSQASQRVSSLGVSVQIDFATQPAGGSVELTLIGPNDTSAVLGTVSTFRPHPDATSPTRWVLSAVYPTMTPTEDLSVFHTNLDTGWWRLIANNSTGLVGELVGFTVKTIGRLVGPAPGDERQSPQVITLPGIGSQRVESTTSGLNDHESLSCATGSSPDRAFALTLPAAGQLAVDVRGDFDTAVLLASGACPGTLTPLGCDNDSGHGVASALATGDLAAGDYCVIVDGNGNQSGDFVLRVHYLCVAGEHDGGDRVCVSTATCSTGYKQDAGGDCTLCATGYHDDGVGSCVPEGQCAQGFVDGGDGSCVPNGTCAAGYHDGGEGACVLEGTCSTGYAPDGGGDCTLCAAGYHDGGDGSCVVQGTCATDYHDGGDGVCVREGTCSLGYHFDGLGTCVVLGTCATDYHDGGFGECVPSGTCEDSHILGGGGDCAACRAGFSTNASGQCLASILACPGNDQHEPNDDAATAASLFSGQRIDGVFCSSDFDWFELTVPTGCTIHASLYHAHSEGDLGLAMLDRDFSEQIFTGVAQDNAFLSWQPPIEDIYVVVFAPGGADSTRYALYADLECP